MYVGEAETYRKDGRGGSETPSRCAETRGAESSNVTGAIRLNASVHAGRRRWGQTAVRPPQRAVAPHGGRTSGRHRASGQDNRSTRLVWPDDLQINSGRTSLRKRPIDGPACRRDGVRGPRPGRLPAPPRDHRLADRACAGSRATSGLSRMAASTASTTACCCAVRYQVVRRRVLRRRRPFSAARQPPPQRSLATGSEFNEQERAGHATLMPAYCKLRPEREALAWHMDTVFKSA